MSTGTPKAEKVYNVSEDLGDGLTRALFDIDGADWWEYHYWAPAAPDGRRFGVKVPVTPELVDSEGPEVVRSLVVRMWQDALDQALEAEGAPDERVGPVSTGTPPCDCGLSGEDRACHDGDVYGWCGVETCYGQCEYEGICDCSCHGEELYALAFEAMGREPEPDERWGA